MVVVTREISERKKYEEKLLEFAYHDPLTLLPNRRYFQDILSRKIDEAKERGYYNFAVAMIDLDNLKQLNDRYGHDYGDEAIKIFSMRVKNSLREDDIVARFGGDEFIIVLSDVVTKAEGVTVVKRILDKIQKPAHIKGIYLNLTASVGITIPTSIDITEKEIFKQADTALYNAKQAGKNTYDVLIPE